MPLEIILKARRGTLILVESRHSIFLVEESRTGKTTGEVWTWHIVGTTAVYGNWIMGKKCCAPEQGEPLFIETSGSINDIMITTKIRKIRKV